MVFILMTACCALVVGGILGVLIRCPLVFCTFWLFSDDSCTHPRLSMFMSLTMGKNLLHPSPFPASAVFRHPYFSCLWLLLPLGVCTMPLPLVAGLNLLVQHRIAAGCWLSSLDTSPPSCRNCPSAQSRRLPQHRQGSSGF